MNQRNSINRRSFLGRSLVGLGALAGVPTLLSQIPQKSSAAPIAINYVWYEATLIIETGDGTTTKWRNRIAVDPNAKPKKLRFLDFVQVDSQSQPAPWLLTK